MYIAYEYLLIAGILGFYLQDAGMLVFHDEFVLEKPARTWRAHAGGHLQVAKRELYMPNVFAPWAPVFKGLWSKAKRGKVQGKPAFERLLSALRPVQGLATLQGVVLLVCVPAAVLFKRHPYLMLALLAITYAVSIALLVVAVLKHADLQLTRKKAWSLGLEGVLCPPFAINAVRRITRVAALPEPALAYAGSVLDADTARALSQGIEERIAIDALYAEDDSARSASLQDLRIRVQQCLESR